MEFPPRQITAASGWKESIRARKVGVSNVATRIPRNSTRHARPLTCNSPRSSTRPAERRKESSQKTRMFNGETDNKINYFICRHKCTTMGKCNTEIHRLRYKQPYPKYRNNMIIKITHSHTIYVSQCFRILDVYTRLED